MVSTKVQIQAFDPSPGAVRPTKADIRELSDSEAKAALKLHPTKSEKVKTHHAMEGERTGLPHLTPMSLRYQRAHAAMGTKVTPPGDGP